jgi:hypothetical protein
MSDSGKLTTAAVEALGMTKDERNQVQSALNTLRSSAQKAVAERAELDNDASDLENGKTVYSIPAAPDRGQSLLDAFKLGMIDSLGQDRGTRLFKAFDPRTQFGGFGRYDVVLEFQDDGNEGRVKWKYYSPTSGDTASSAEMIFEAFEEYFGGSFILAEAEE